MRTETKECLPTELKGVIADETQNEKAYKVQQEGCWDFYVNFFKIPRLKVTKLYLILENSFQPSKYFKFPK